MKKNLIALLLALSMTLALTACGSKAPAEEEIADAPATEEVAPETGTPSLSCPKSIPALTPPPLPRRTPTLSPACPL